MPRMRALGSWRTSQRGLGALHHALRGSSFAPGGASSSRCRGRTSRTSSGPGVVLRRTAEELDRGAQPAEDELLLLRDLVDTQIVDVAGRRLVRAGDVDLERRDGQLVLAGVDVGGGALLRRLGLRRLARRFSSRCLPWSELYAASPAAHTVQLRVDRDGSPGSAPRDWLR